MVTGRYERVVHSPRFSLSVIDRLARELATTVPNQSPAEVEIRIVKQQAPVVRDFTPPLQLWTVRNRSGYLLLDGTYFRPGTGGQRGVLGPGVYDVEVRAPGYQTSRGPLDWTNPTPRLPVNVELNPGANYPYPELSGRPYGLGPTLLRGSVFQPDGTPLTGAVASVPNLVFNPAWPFTRCEVSETGDWAILLPDRRRFTGFPEEQAAPVTINVIVRITPPVGAPVDVSETVSLGGEHRIPNTALRGEVRGAGGRPVAGARLTTSVNPLASVSGPDGRWSLYFGLNQPDVNNVTVTATLPGGATRSLANQTVARRRTLVVPTIQFP
jgi:hypothetical protein